MAADDHRDKKFITLLRQSHTLPFALLPCTQRRPNTEQDLNHPGTMYAVFQPVDRINTRVLDDLEQAHRDRHAWQQKESMLFNHASSQGAAVGQPANGLKHPHPEKKNGFQPDLNGSLQHDAMEQAPEAKVWQACLYSRAVVTE